MVITPKDVDADLLLLTQSIEDKNRPLINPWNALRLSMLWPMSCSLTYILSMLWTIYNFKPYVNHFDRFINVFDEYGMSMGFAAVGVLMALLIGAGLYGKALIYLSVDVNVRRKSLIVSRIRRIAINLGRVFFILNAGMAILAAIYPDLLAGAPFVIMISFLIMAFVINAEVARLGIPSLLAKLSGLVRKI